MCWRAHAGAISSVRCAAVSGIQEQDLLLISSQDCTVSLWSLQGGLVGVMGKHTWTLSDHSTWQDAKVHLPVGMHLLCESFVQAGLVSTILGQLFSYI